MQSRIFAHSLFAICIFASPLRGAPPNERVNPWFDEDEYLLNYQDLRAKFADFRCPEPGVSPAKCRSTAIQAHFTRIGLREGRLGRLAAPQESLRDCLQQDAKSPEAIPEGEADQPERLGDYRRDFSIEGLGVVTTVVRGPSTTRPEQRFRNKRPEETSEQYLRSLVELVHGGAVGKVVLPKQMLHLKSPSTPANSPYHFVFRDISDVEIDFGGSTFVLTDLTKRGLAVTGHSERLRLKNLVMTWEVDFASPASLRSDNGKVLLQLNRQPPANLSIHDFFGFYDGDARRWNAQQGRTLSVYFRTPLSTEKMRQEIDQTDVTKELQSALQKEPIYAGLARHHLPGKHALVIEGENVQDVQLESIEVRGSPYMAFSVRRIKRGFLIRDSKVTTQEEGFISSASDALHLSEAGGDIAIINNSFTGQGDDGINIESHTFPLEVEAAHIRVQDPRGIQFVGKHDDIAMIYDELMDFVGAAKLAEISKEDGGYEVTFKEPDGLAAKPATGFRLGLLRTYPKRIVIEGNAIGLNRGRGILMQGSMALIQKNQISDTSANAIKLTADSEIFQEGMGSVGVLIHSNQITNCNYGNDESTNSRSLGAINIGAEVRATKSMFAMRPELTFLGGTFARYPLFQNISIIDNQFSNNLGASIFVTSATDVTISRNQGMKWTAPSNAAIGRRQGITEVGPVIALQIPELHTDAPAVRLWPERDSVLTGTETH